MMQKHLSVTVYDSHLRLWKVTELYILKLYISCYTPLHILEVPTKLSASLNETKHNQNEKK